MKLWAPKCATGFAQFETIDLIAELEEHKQLETINEDSLCNFSNILYSDFKSTYYFENKWRNYWFFSGKSYFLLVNVKDHKSLMDEVIF